MFKLKLFLILTIARTSKWAARLLGKGSGTALPGLIVEKYLPASLDYFSSQLQEVILITGTNGKTTTREIINHILDKAGTNYISNKSGSNMKRGLLSSFIAASSLTGRLHSKRAIFEIEEATLPRIAKLLKPSTIVVTNLFRDQLDAYGEVDITQKYIRAAIEQIPKAKIILNLDDPLVRGLTKGLPNETSYFSIPAKYLKEFDFEGDADMTPSKLRPNTIKPITIKLEQNLGTSFTLDKRQYTLSSPGIHNVYNALAAIQVVRELAIDPEIINRALSSFQPAFGRGEEIIHNDIKYKIMLIKNPAGFTLTLNLLSKIKNPQILFIINDNIADGRDVSWLWDAKLELLDLCDPKLLLTSGQRAEDMALRLKYALHMHGNIFMESDIKAAINLIETQATKDEIVYVLPTYTAMNQFRLLLGKRF